MPLTAGTRLGPYEIIRALGAGGMGEVYRARDSRLGRDVAIKVLPDSVVHDPDRLARFEREARVLAALNHSLIAHVYGFEQIGDRHAIVMEFVDGPTLEERIAQGPILIPEALHIARQLAEALETAHELGIIHRDLKPANIKLKVRGAPPPRTPDGRLERRLSAADVEDCTVKVLDFGLAKALDTAAGTSADALNSPTLTARATELGTILGTAAYMAPEQARGKAVDRRADVWAFGVVLYEMLTGTRLFKGEGISDTMAAVLRQPIEFAALPAATPATVRTLLRRCLERDPKQRLRDIGEARITLERVVAGNASGERSNTDGAAADKAAQRAAAPLARRMLPWGLFTVTAIALVIALTRSAPTAPISPASAPGPVTRLVSTIGAPGLLMIDIGPAAVLSPDGRTIVFRVSKDNNSKLFVRHLDQLDATELAGTENALNPFFSPDGSTLGFFASGGLKTIPISGGAATTVVDAATGRGAAWAENGDILFQSSILPKTPLVRVTSSGAHTDRGTTLAAEEVTHRWPQFLPGGKVLYGGNSDVSEWNSGTLRVQTQPGLAGKVVLRGGFHGKYVLTGHLLYVHAGTLYGVRFDLDRIETVGQPVPVVDKVVTSTGTGGAQFSVSNNGTLAYVRGDSSAADGSIYWMTTDGKTSALKAAPGAWGNPNFSPDGKLLAMQRTYGSHDQITIYDWTNDRLTQVTFDAANHRFPIWTPDGQRIIYSSDAGHPGVQNIYWQRANGSGPADRLTDSPTNQVATSVDPRGNSILFSEFAGGTGADIWVLPLHANGQPGTPRPFLITPTYETHGTFSPDGKWIAYMSSEQGSFEIYVRKSEGAGGPWRVSTAGGAHPTWSKNTQELLYVIDDQIMTVKYRLRGDAFEHERPRAWAPARYANAGPTRKYAIHPDGKRVIVATPDTTAAAKYDAVTFVFNFFDELKRLLPPGR
jgi:serine/threonine-protein kinase